MSHQALQNSPQLATLSSPHPSVSTAGRSSDVFWMSLLVFWSLFCALGLIAVTYRLWLPPDWSNFPQIPATALLIKAPAWCDYAAIIGLAVSLLIAMLNSLAVGCMRSGDMKLTRLHQSSVVAILVFGIALVLLNQHRLQAWFYQLLIYCGVFLLSNSSQQLLWLRRIVLSIYVYSALGKLDFEFAHTTGQELLGAAFRTMGLTISDWSAVDRITLALGLPLTELLLGIALGWALFKPQVNSGVSNNGSGGWGRVLRALPGLFTCLFHLLLSGLLLWQLRHSWGVVLWNLQFAIQAILLFVLPTLEFRRLSAGNRTEASTQPRRMLDNALIILLVATMAMPVLERLGYWDHWPSWALYAPHSSRVAVSVAPHAVEHLPKELRSILAELSTDDSELQIPLGQWSLNSLGVPVYPQSRFQLGVARYLASRLESQYAISGQLLSSADRFTGDRQSQILRGVDQLKKASDRFWLNSQPRQPTNVDLTAGFSATTD
jgi:hypothetical protein